VRQSSSSRHDHFFFVAVVFFRLNLNLRVLALVLGNSHSFDFHSLVLNGPFFHSYSISDLVGLPAFPYSNNPSQCAATFHRNSISGVVDIPASLYCSIPFQRVLIFHSFCISAFAILMRHKGDTWFLLAFLRIFFSLFLRQLFLFQSCHQSVHSIVIIRD